jgi:hypothetical protein
VPREMKVEHSGGVKDMSDGQIEAAIEAIQAMLAARLKVAKSLGIGTGTVQRIANELSASSPFRFTFRCASDVTVGVSRAPWRIVESRPFLSAKFYRANRVHQRFACLHGNCRQSGQALPSS